MSIFCVLLGGSYVFASDQYGMAGATELVDLTKQSPAVKTKPLQIEHPLNAIWAPSFEECNKIPKNIGFEIVDQPQFALILLKKKENYAKYLKNNLVLDDIGRINSREDGESGREYERVNNRKTHKNGFIRHRVVVEERHDDGDNTD